MTPPDEQLDPDLAALLQRGAPRPSLPDDVNARLLRRAAASTVATAGVLAIGTSAKVALASVVAVVVTAGGVWTATRAPTAPAAPAAVVVSAPAEIAAPPAPAPTPAVPVEEAVVEAVPFLNEPAPPAAAPAKRVAVVDEVSLLEQARVAIGEGRFAEAEAALVQHRRQHPRGSLSEEREALMVVTLARRGATARAQQAASSFRRRFEHSAFAALVDAAVAAP